MGRIHQADFDIRVPAFNQLSLNITQWRYIDVYEETTGYHLKGIDVCGENQVHFIYNISLDTFNEINYKNESVQFKYEYKCTHIACRKCHGKGVIDWIDRATPGSRQPYNIELLGGKNYIRNKKGPVNLYVLGWNKEKKYSSTPKLREGEEFCPECFGCGITMSKSKRCGKTVFERC